MRDDSDIDRVIGDALDSAARGEPVLVDVRIDYSKRTRFTEGVIRTNLKRFGLADQARLVGRALWRRLDRLNRRAAARSRRRPTCSLAQSSLAVASVECRPCAAARADSAVPYGATIAQSDARQLCDVLLG